MVKVVEVVLELEATGFINSGKVTRGRVIRTIPKGDLSCKVDNKIKGVAVPQGVFASIDEARDALLDYWEKCNTAIQNDEYWTPKLG